jgi:RNA polymerase sigma-70 factor, ECF subfamily
MATRRQGAARAAADRSFEELYRGHRADVFRAALRELGNVHDAEDVTQAAFVDAYRAVLRGSEPRSPRAWLLAIAANVRRRRYRTAQRRPREQPTDADFPLTAELPNELARALAEALGELPPEGRRVFVLRELGGLSYEEIADATGTSVGAVQMQLFRARRELRALLEPPPAARRRAGLVVPLPGWLATITSRADLTALAPRAAGAVGATALAVAGTTVIVGERSQPQAPTPEPGGRAVTVQQQRGESPGDAARPLPRAAPRPVAATGARKPVPRSSGPRPRRAATPQARAVDPPPTAPPVAVTVQPPVEESAAARVARPVGAAVASAAETLAAVPEPLRLPVEALVEETEAVLELPGPPPPPSPVVEAVTGAAGAAGASVPPLPVPGLPLSTTPPTP